MNDSKNVRPGLDDILNLDLGFTKAIGKSDGVDNPVEQRQVTHEGFDKSYVVPIIGDAHPTKEYLIGVNTVGYFDTNKMKFVHEPRTLNDKILQDVLRLVGYLKADELFMQDNEPLKIKFGHRTRAISTTRYSGDEIHEVIGKLVNTSVPGRIIGGESEPFTLQVTWINRDKKEASLRFRGNGTRTLGTNGSTNGVTYAIRRLGDEIPSMDELGIDQSQRDLLFPKAGIVIVAGETGSGKTTYLGSVIRHWVTQPDGIVLSTYEYPVEFDFRPIASPDCVVGQSDLGNSLHGSFANAAKDAMRRNSDVILIGEVRDKDSAAGAMNLALSGHLVYCTFHAGSPMQAMSRIISYFPEAEQPAIRNTLIGTMQAIICVKLIPTIDDKRVQIRGHLGLTHAIREKLYPLNEKNFTAGLKEIYESEGHTMSMDLDSYIDRIDADSFTSLKKIFN